MKRRTVVPVNSRTISHTVQDHLVNVHYFTVVAGASETDLLLTVDQVPYIDSEPFSLVCQPRNPDVFHVAWKDQFITRIVEVRQTQFDTLISRIDAVGWGMELRLDFIAANDVPLAPLQEDKV